MKLDITPSVFNAYTNEKKKKHIANLLIKESGATSVPLGAPPIAFVMAGLPGAGKTEFLDTMSQLILDSHIFEPFVRIDLDEIVTVYPEYTPKDYYKFRNQGNLVLARCVDVARHGRYNMMIDGTFSGKSGASIDTIGRLLNDGYIVKLFYMYDRASTAWEYTKKREQETSRGIDRQGFLEACTDVVMNLKEARLRHGTDNKFELDIVVQKDLRDRDYYITSENEDIDNILNTPYNIDILKG